MLNSVLHIFHVLVVKKEELLIDLCPRLQERILMLNSVLHIPNLSYTLFCQQVYERFTIVLLNFFILTVNSMSWIQGRELALLGG